MVKHKEYRRVSTIYIPVYYEEWIRNICGRHEVCWVNNMPHQWGTDWAIRYMKWYKTKKWSMWLHHGKHLYEMRSIITGILIRVRIEHIKDVNLQTKKLGCN